MLVATSAAVHDPRLAPAAAASPTAALVALDSAALSRRLAQLAGDEREVQVTFLLHLEEFDRRRAWAEAGHGSLWDWCLKVLHLREGAAGRRIAAMRVLRRFPELADHLRDGRLCLSTAALLGPVLTEETFAQVTERAAYLTRAEVERLVATLAPRAAPRDGVRKLAVGSFGPAAPEPAPRDAARDLLAFASAAGASPEQREAAPSSGPAVRAADRVPEQAHPTATPASVRPIDAESYSLRVTIDAAFKAELEQLKELLAHKVPQGELATVLREAVQCAIRHHAKRKGLVASPRRPAHDDRRSATSSRQPARRAIPAEVRRQVWARDGACCAWRGPDGKRCGSRWKLELDHIRPLALGGPSTIESSG
jgi:hypothetical protein